MQFNSVDFMIFFPIVLLIYFIVPRKVRKCWLLIASYYFYMSYNVKHGLLLLATTLLTYITGILVEKTNNKRFILTLSIIINIGILVFFKYTNFLIDSINKLLSICNIEVAQRNFSIVMPLGISFYTFQIVGYLIDIYRQKVKAERNFISYALFVSFFPQLLSGPIARSSLLNQIDSIKDKKLWNYNRISSGFIIMVYGYFMKMVVSDRASILSNYVFNNYRMLGGTELVFGAIIYALQIYFDFASYSYMAIGIAKILGFELIENFNTPYYAKSIRDFWSRWHISLSTWFRDYLYIPLGGNRKGKLKKAINIMVVFLVSGLWHGSNWHYVAWGGVHGLYQVIADVTYKFREKLKNKLNIKKDCFSYRLLQTIITFSLVTFAWVFFKSNSIKDAMRYFKRILIKQTPWVLFNGGLYNLGLDRAEFNILFISTLFIFIFDYIKCKRNISVDEFLFEQNLWFKWFVIIGMILLTFIFGEYGPAFDAQSFIYFQF